MISAIFSVYTFVSIHAPVMDAKQNVLSDAAGTGVSIHAPVMDANWGVFQIMGYHWKQLGYDSAVDFVLTLSLGEPEHLDAFVRFILNNQTLLTAIRAKDWKLFARTYNGRNYAKNKYDVKMRQAEKRWRDKGVNSPVITSQCAG